MSDALARMRLWWQQLAAVMIKEGKQVTRDPSSWIIAVVLPLTFLFLFGFGVSLDTTVVKIAMVREDGGRGARAPSELLTPCNLVPVLLLANKPSCTSKNKHNLRHPSSNT